MRLNDIRIGYRLALGFGLMLAMLAGMTAIALLASTQTRAKLNATIAATKAKSSHVAAMRQSLFRQGLAARNIGMLTDVAEMEKEMAKISAAHKTYAESRAALASSGLSSDEQSLLTEMAQHEKNVEPLMRQASQFVAAFNARQAVQVLTVQAAPIQDQWLEAIDRMVRLQNRQIEDSLAAFETASDRANLWMTVIAAVSMLLAVAVAWLLTRSITAPLREAVAIAQRVAAGDLSIRIASGTRDETGQLLSALEDMNNSLTGIVGGVRSGTETIGVASREIASGNADLSSRTEAQASALEQTAASIAQLTSIVQKNAENAMQANALTMSASGIAEQGGQVVGKVVDTMGSIRDRSRRIADIIGVIDGIAFQTNILALNAAVESARAGEHGRGFAVVAGEVRSLAQRAAGAAKEIKLLIDDSVATVDAGAELVESAGQTMQQIVASVKRVADIMREIASASEAQNAGIAEVNVAIASMDAMTQQNAALVEQAAAAAQSMQQQAQALVQAVSVFKVDACGSAVFSS